MPKYLFHGHYTNEGVKGVLKEGGTGRQKAVESILKSLGGTLESMHFAFGKDDYFIIADLPDNVSAAAVSLTVSGTGAVGNTVTVLLSPEEIDAAVKKHPSYRPPGQ